MNCFVPLAIYHTTTKQASCRRICRNIGLLFPSVVAQKYRLLKHIVRNALLSEKANNAWEIQIQNFGHTILRLRNTMYTLQPIEKRSIHIIVLENTELEDWDSWQQFILIAYVIGFIVAWILQTNSYTCFPRYSIH